MKHIYLFILCFLFVIGSVNASTPNWDDTNFSYHSEGGSLRELLNAFGSNYDLPVQISDRIDEKVNGTFRSMTAKTLLNQLSRLYGLVWYYDGAVLHVDLSDEMKTKLIQLKHSTSDDLQKILRDVGVYDKRFGWKSIDGGKIIYVSGPPRYIELIEEMQLVVDKPPMEKENVQEALQNDSLLIEIIPLKYASAIDRTIQYRQDTVTVPGVATILKRILNQYSEQSGDGSSQGSDVRVQADPRMNALVIRDTQKNMPLYRHLIEKLDVPQRRIELALYIVDIDVSDIDQLGVDWRGGFRVGSNGYVDVTSTGSTSGSEGLALSNGDVLGTVLNSQASHFFLSRLRLLESRGNAQVVSRPTLLTQENVEAVLDNSSTFYVRVTGEREVDLKEISYGTLLRILPRVIQNKDDETVINLALHIEDGNRLGAAQNVADLPTILNTVIDTEASVRLGQSLLIGGIYVDRVETIQQGVPLLSKVPIAGKLFSSTTNSIRKQVRMFMIEPRIITDLPQPTITSNYRTAPKAVSVKQQLEDLSVLSNQEAAVHAWTKKERCKPLSTIEPAYRKFKAQGKPVAVVQCNNLQGKQGWMLVKCPKNKCAGKLKKISKEYGEHSYPTVKLSEAATRGNSKPQALESSLNPSLEQELNEYANVSPSGNAPASNEGDWFDPEVWNQAENEQLDADLDVKTKRSKPNCVYCR